MAALFFLCALVAEGTLKIVQSPAWARSPEVLLTSPEPRTELSRIYSNAEEWRSMRLAIASGDGKWLSTGLRFLEVSDGGAASEILLSLGEALEHDAGAVLESVPTRLLSHVCSGPDVDDFRYGTLKLSQAALELRMAKVQAVVSLSTSVAKQVCFSALQRASRGLVEYFESDE